MNNATNVTNGKLYKAAVREEKGDISLSNAQKTKDCRFNPFVVDDVQNEDPFVKETSQTRLTSW